MYPDVRVVGRRWARRAPPPKGTVATMAWMTRKGNRWLVRWRDDGSKRAKSFGSEQEAVAFKATVEPPAIDRVIASLPSDKREFVLHG